MATKGYAAPEVEQAYTRARELCQQVGETPQLFPVLWGLWQFYIVRAEFQTARELGEQLLSLAQRVQDPALLLEAHHALGITLFCLGELAPARAHLEQGIALYDPQQHQLPGLSLWAGPRGGLPHLCGLDPVVCWAIRTRPCREAHEALTLAQELSHPFSLAFMPLLLRPGLHQFRREGQAAQERAEALHDPLDRAGVSALAGAWALSCRAGRWPSRDREKKGIAQIRQGLAAYRATGAELERPYYLALLAEAYGKVGTGRGRAERAGRGAGCGGQNWGAFVRGGAVSAERGADAPTVSKFKVQSLRVDRRSRSVFSEGHRDCPPAAGEVAGAARGDEPGSAVAAAGQARKKLTSCYPRSTTGSPKGLTPKTCKRRRRCWRSCTEAANYHPRADCYQTLFPHWSKIINTHPTEDGYLPSLTHLFKLPPSVGWCP